MTGRKWRTLTEELAELERTDPAVKQAAENYDRVVAEMLRKDRQQRIAILLAAFADQDWIIMERPAGPVPVEDTP